MIILIYLIGAVTNYFLGRLVFKNIVNLNGKYTEGDRILNIMISLLSWIAVLSSGIMYMVFHKSNKDASW